MRLDFNIYTKSWFSHNATQVRKNSINLVSSSLLAHFLSFLKAGSDETVFFLFFFCVFFALPRALKARFSSDISLADMPR